MKRPESALDDLQRHMAEVMRQYIGGGVNSEAEENARRYLREAEETAQRMRTELEEIETSVFRARAELTRITRQEPEMAPRWSREGSLGDWDVESGETGTRLLRQARKISMGQDHVEERQELRKVHA